MRLLFVDHGIPGGIDAVNQKLLPRLPAYCEEVVCVAPEYRLRDLCPRFGEVPGLRFEAMHWPEGGASGLLRRVDGLARRAGAPAGGMRKALESARLRTVVARHRLTHCLCTWIFDVLPPRIDIPVGAMVMDLNWRVFPENFPKPTAEYDAIFRHWLEEASALFPISEFTENSLRTAFPDVSAPTVVVPHGAEASAAVATREALRPYFYYPASVFAHKRHEVLFEAMRMLFEAGRDFDLVLTGGRTDRIMGESETEEKPVLAARQALRTNGSRFAKRVRGLGYVDAAQVEELYAGCRSVVLPSTYEGFGLPLLEALERGRPVIASDIEPFREQARRYECNDVVRFVAPGDAHELAGAMDDVLSGRQAEPEQREVARRLGAWTWDDVARSYVELLARPNQRPEAAA